MDVKSKMAATSKIVADFKISAESKIDSKNELSDPISIFESKMDQKCKVDAELTTECKLAAESRMEVESKVGTEFGMSLRSFKRGATPGSNKDDLRLLSSNISHGVLPASKESGVECGTTTVGGRLGSLRPSRVLVSHFLTSCVQCFRLLYSIYSI